MLAHLKGEAPGYEAEYRMRRKDDHWVWILARAKVVQRDDSGRALRMVGTVLDITERKHGEEALKAREARLARLIGSMQELVFVIDTDGKITEYHQPESFHFPVTVNSDATSPMPRLVKILQAISWPVLKTRSLIRYTPATSMATVLAVCMMPESTLS